MAIRQDAAGRFCLNDLHRAAGGEKRHGPSYWLANEQTRGLVAELGTTGIPAVATAEGAAGGTYVARELVYSYAMWVSPVFHLKVIRAYDALVTRPSGMNAGNLTRLELLQIAMQAEQERVALEAEVSALAPKAAALERIAEATRGSVGVRVAAGLAQVAQSEFVALMIEQRWLHRKGGRGGLLGCAEKVKAGLLEMKRVELPRADGPPKVVARVFFTERGLAKAVELIERKAPHLRKAAATGSASQRAIDFDPEGNSP